MWIWGLPKCVVSFCLGEKSWEESQQDGVQGRKKPTGEAAVELENKYSRLEALVADCSADTSPPGHDHFYFSGIKENWPKTKTTWILINF